MTLTENISRQLNDLNFVPLGEARHQYHLYADYVELLALFANGDYVSDTHLVSRLSNEGVQFTADILDGDTGEEIGSLNGQMSDSDETWSSEVFSVISDRNYLFDVKYPFVFKENRISLKDDLSEIQKIYLMLLVASNLKYFKILQPKLASEFELISFFVLKNYLPNNACVKQFGRQSDYTGTAIEKIKKLSVDMGVGVDEDELAGISLLNTQEEGLDIVGWIPFADNIPSMISIFCQCACGSKWANKQNETKRYEEFFNFYKVPPIHSLFIPYALGGADRKFFQSKDINKGMLMFDRRRILTQLEDTTFFTTSDSWQIVNRFIEFEEEIA